ncbi:MAG: DUF1134 domain-containing protein [Maricaulaceae bacterium]
MIWRLARIVLLSGMTAVLMAGGAAAQDAEPAPGSPDTFSEDEISDELVDFFGVTAEAGGAVVERVFSEQGDPVGYIAGEELAAAFIGGVRYGRGELVMKTGERRTVFWQGPSAGFDFGGNASKSFTLVYNITDAERIFCRFPGVEGSGYFIAGLGVNYQRADGVTLAPIRTGVGLRFGANIGYLAYSKRRNILPF